MRVIYISDFKQDINVEEECNLTIGFFDALHIGHKHIISKLINSDNSLKKMVVTFDFHPFKKMITPLNEKINQIEKLGVDYLVIIQMSDKIRLTNKCEFISFLQKININKIFIGSDFRFGKLAEGDISLLEKYFDVDIVEFVKNDTLKISSTEIRVLVDEGRVDEVKKYIGTNYSIKGAVVHGNQIGRTLDFPTANIVTEYLVPKFGVYHTRTHFEGVTYLSITNIGRRPTIGDNKVTIETHIIGFDRDIYGFEIYIEFLEYIRGEIKFNSIEELKDNIKKDIKYVKEKNGN